MALRPFMEETTVITAPEVAVPRRYSKEIASLWQELKRIYAVEFDRGWAQFRATVYSQVSHRIKEVHDHASDWSHPKQEAAIKRISRALGVWFHVSQHQLRVQEAFSRRLRELCQPNA